MKANIGVSFVRAWAEKAADCNETYPGYAQYFYSFDYDGTSVSGGSMHTKDPNVFTTNRSNYLGLVMFENNSQQVVHPMYHKDEANTIYNPAVHTSWSGFMDGQPAAKVESGKDTASVGRILQATLMPGTVLFKW
jgi:23S rRNA A1618 N6-methylase RlmF